MILLLVAGVSLLLWCLRAMAYLTVSFRMTLVLCLHMLTCNFAPPTPGGCCLLLQTSFLSLVHAQFSYYLYFDTSSEFPTLGQSLPILCSAINSFELPLWLSW